MPRSCPRPSTSGLTKFYGKSRASWNLDIEVKTDEVFGFLGPNGAGKPTPPV